MNKKKEVELDIKEFVKNIKYHQFISKERGEEVSLSYGVKESDYNFLSLSSFTPFFLNYSTFIDKGSVKFYPNGRTQNQIIRIKGNDYIGIVYIRSVTGKISWRIDKSEQ